MITRYENIDDRDWRDRLRDIKWKTCGEMCEADGQLILPFEFPEPTDQPFRGFPQPSDGPNSILMAAAGARHERR